MAVLVAAVATIFAGAPGALQRAVAVSLPDCSATVHPPCIFQGFEIDGNTSVDVNGVLDWKTPAPNLTHFQDATGASDDIFSGGSKELDQTSWVCTTGSAPPKSDVYPGGDLSFRTIKVNGVDHQVVDVDFTRVGTGGDAHIDYEFNKASSFLTTGGCQGQGIPVRSIDDILLAFDSDRGGSKVTISAFRWTGSTYKALDTGSEGTTFEGVENGITSNGKTSLTDPGVDAGQFGEGALDLTATIGTLTCGEFGTVMMKTRSSSTINSEVKDRVRPLPFNPGACPNSSLAKAVRNDTTGGGFSAGPISASPGDQLTYQLTYKNEGQAPATNVTLSDPLPARSTLLSCNPPTCSLSNGTISWPAVGSVAPQGTLTYTFTVRLDATFPQGTTEITNIATVSTKEEGSKSSNQVKVTVTANPALAITKTADSSSVKAGQQIGYVIKVTNTGNAAASSVKVTDTLPNNAGLSWIVASNGGATCGISGGVLTCTLATLAPGVSLSIHITSQTTLATCGTVSNGASVEATGVSSVNSGPLTTIEVTCPRSSLTKGVRNVTTDTPPNRGYDTSVNASPGDIVSYKLTYTNNGTAAATSVTVSDPIPARTTYVDGSCQPSDCTATGGTISWGPIAQVAAGDTLTFTFSVRLDATFPQGTTQITNIATVTTSEEGSTKSNETTVTVTANPALTITKTADAPSVSNGDQIGYVIKVTNTGNAAASSVTVTDTLPNNAGLNWTVANSGGATCAISSGKLTCTLATLAPGATLSVHITSPTTAATCGTVGNSASVTATGVTSLSSEPLTTIVVNCAVIGITKAADAPTVAAGQQVGYTITVTNSGDGTARNVKVSDTLPNSPSGLIWSMSPAVSGCSVSNTNPQVLSCTFATVAPHTSISIHVVSSTTTSMCGRFTNKATATSDNAGSPSTGDVPITLTCPKLSITKTADAPSISAGDQIGYVIKVTNSGDGAATDVRITDTLPSGYSWALSPPNTPSGCTISGTSLTCGPSTLAPGASVEIHVVATTAPANCGTASNQATVTSANNVPLSITTGVATVIVKCPNVGITKTPDAATVVVGDQIGYTIKVTNTGQGDAKNVVVSDTLPNNAGLSWSLDPNVTECSISNANPQVLTCTFPVLAAGTSISIHVVSPTTVSSCGPVSNSASVTLSNGTGPNTGPVVINVTCAVLHVTKTACPEGSVAPGGLLTYTINYSNTGTATADPATLVDTLPADTVVADPGGGTISPDGTTLTWQVGPLAPGAGGTKTFSVQVNAANGTTVVNTVTLSAPQAGGVVASDTVSTLVSNAGAITHGSAYGLDANVLAVPVLTNFGLVSTVAPGGPLTASKTALTVPSVLNLIGPGAVVDTSSNSSVGNQAESMATATTTALSLFDGGLTADVVRGVSHSVADATTATYDSSGSTFVNLKVNGAPQANVTPNTHVLVVDPVLHLTVADVTLYEESGTATFSNGLWSSSHSITMIDAKLLVGVGTLPAGAHVKVAGASSDATYPSGLACGERPSTVSGNAFSAYANGTIQGTSVSDVQVGDAVLPPYGGGNSDNLAAVAIPGIVGAGAATNYTNGATSPSPTATSGASITGLDLLNGLVTANLIDVKATSSAPTLSSASTSFGSTCAGKTCAKGCSTSSPCFVNLTVNGVTIVGVNGGTVAPNTTIAVPQPGGDVILILLNEQVTAGSGGNTTGDINAVHVFVLKGGTTLSGEVIVAHAHSDAHHS